MIVNISLFKPSGKWYTDDEIILPDDTTMLNLIERVVEAVYKDGDYKWNVVVHNELQFSEKAADVVGFPRLIKISNYK